jgi:hypothetical protein
MPTLVQLLPKGHGRPLVVLRRSKVPFLPIAPEFDSPRVGFQESVEQGAADESEAQPGSSSHRGSSKALNTQGLSAFGRMGVFPAFLPKALNLSAFDEFPGFLP